MDANGILCLGRRLQNFVPLVASQMSSADVDANALLDRLKNKPVHRKSLDANKRRKGVGAHVASERDGNESSDEQRDPNSEPATSPSSVASLHCMSPATATARICVSSDVERVELSFAPNVAGGEVTIPEFEKYESCRDAVKNSLDSRSINELGPNVHQHHLITYLLIDKLPLPKDFTEEQKTSDLARLVLTCEQEQYAERYYVRALESLRVPAALLEGLSGLRFKAFIKNICTGRLSAQMMECRKIILRGPKKARQPYIKKDGGAPKSADLSLPLGSSVGPAVPCGGGAPKSAYLSLPFGSSVGPAVPTIDL